MIKSATMAHSEQVLDPELHLPRRCIARARNASKRRRTKIAVRRLKAWRVRDVIALDADLNGLLLGHAQRFAERDIQTPLRRSVHRANADVPRRELGLERKCRRIEPTLNGLWAGIGIASQIRPVAAANIGLGRRINDGVSQAC